MTTAVPRDAEATRRRLLEAAASEFAQHGIAGARVDRIAAEAKSNKAQIYHYYGSKDDLFDAVFEQLVLTVVTEVPIDADDLPGYAVRLHDGYQTHPEIARLATWYRLERGHNAPLLTSVLTNNADKVAAIAQAQDTGALGTTFTPEILLGLVIHAGAFWVSQTPEYLSLTAKLGNAQRRDVVKRLVDAIV